VVLSISTLTASSSGWLLCSAYLPATIRKLEGAGKTWLPAKPVGNGPSNPGPVIRYGLNLGPRVGTKTGYAPVVPGGQRDERRCAERKPEDPPLVTGA
jgi:hypothetical protein